MKITTHVRQEKEPINDLSDLLEGRVFHATKLAYLPSILTDREIRSNRDGILPTTFGSSANSFFRNRNCVSLFDYRLEPTEKIEEFRMWCSPFQPARPGEGGVAILFLKSDVHAVLIPWNCCNQESISSGTGMPIPYVEAGYPGSISIDLIDEIICLKREEDLSSLSAQIKKAQ